VTSDITVLTYFQSTRTRIDMELAGPRTRPAGTEMGTAKVTQQDRSSFFGTGRTTRPGKLKKKIGVGDYAGIKLLVPADSECKNINNVRTGDAKRLLNLPTYHSKFFLLINKR
jgi:hypothetical protein